MLTCGPYRKGTFSLLLPSKASLNVRQRTRNIPKVKDNMGNSLIKGAGIASQAISLGSPIDCDGDAFEQFETYRESANGHLKNFFEKFGLGISHDDLPGLCARPLQPRGSEADQNARISQANAIKDLAKLDDILENIKRQERPYIKAVSPTVVRWCVSWSC
jgi:hypothetical protein